VGPEGEGDFGVGGGFLACLGGEGLAQTLHDRRIEHVERVKRGEPSPYFFHRTAQIDDHGLPVHRREAGRREDLVEAFAAAGPAIAQRRDMLGGRHIIECFLRQRAEPVIGFAAYDSAADHTRQNASGRQHPSQLGRDLVYVGHQHQRHVTDARVEAVVGERESLSARLVQRDAAERRTLPGQREGFRREVHACELPSALLGQELQQQAVAAAEVQHAPAAGHAVAQEFVAGAAVRGAAVAEHLGGHRGMLGVEGLQEGFLRCGSRHRSSLRMPDLGRRTTVEA